MTTPIGSSSSIQASSTSSTSSTSYTVFFMEDLSSKDNKTQEKTSTAFTSHQSTFSQRPYLTSIADLEKHAIAKLGSMDDNNYDEFTKRMKEVASKAGIINPRLAVGIKFKPGAHSFITEQAYPITEKSDWNMVQRDAATMCAYTPNVFVVDGSKYNLPI
jgi:hypothetical protein